MRLAASWLTNAVVLGVTAALLARVQVHSPASLTAAAAVFGVLNTVMKPFLRFVMGDREPPLEAPPLAA